MSVKIHLLHAVLCSAYDYIPGKNNACDNAMEYGVIADYYRT